MGKKDSGQAAVKILIYTPNGGKMKISRNILVLLVAAAAVLAVLICYNLLKSEKAAPAFSGVGVVTGIMYNEDNPSAIIDFQIVHEGETLHGVNILKIHRDKVEFEKDGTKWEQKVQEKPSWGL